MQPILVRLPLEIPTHSFPISSFRWRDGQSFKKYPMRRRIVRCVPKHEIRSDILNSTIDEVLFNLLACNYVCWHWFIGDYLFFYDPALSRIGGSLGLNHVIRMNRPCLCQISELVSRLQRRCSALVEILNHPAGLIEVLIDDAFRTPSKFSSNPWPSRLWIRQDPLPPKLPPRRLPRSP